MRNHRKIGVSWLKKEEKLLPLTGYLIVFELYSASVILIPYSG